MDNKQINIWTWNINSIRKKVDIVNILLLKHNIDILILTETKIRSIHENDIIFNNDYNVIWNSNKTNCYHGVAIIYKKSEIKIELVSSELIRSESNQFSEILSTIVNDEKNKHEKNINIFKTVDIININTDILKAHTTEGRILTVKCEYNNNNFIIVGTYVPNSGVDRKCPLKRLVYRTLCWDKDLYDYLLKLENEYKKIILIGDLNVARHDNDIYKKNINIAGTTIEERTNINNFINNNNWIDTWDHLNPHIINYKERFTFGHTSPNSYCKLRLDYIICSQSLKNNILSSMIDQKYEGSDHVPMGTLFHF